MTSVLPAIATDLNRMSVDSTQDGMPVQEPTPPHNIKQEEEAERGRPRSRTADKDSNGDVSDKDLDEDGDGANGSNSDGPARKRRRSRKGQDKKFACPTPDCGKSYSRAEHLYRHQLNHNPKQMYECDFPGCTRQFVRLDLCNRHKDRHTAKGSTLNRKNSMISHASPIVDGRMPFAPPGSISPEANRPGTGYNKIGQSHLPYHSPKGIGSGPFTPLTNTPPTGYPVGHHQNGDFDPSYAHLQGHRPPASYHSPNPARPAVQTNVGHQYGVVSPVSAQHGFHTHTANTPTQHSAGAYVPPQNFPPFSLPPSDFSQGSGGATAMKAEQSYTPTNGNEYQADAQSQHGSEMMMLDQMAMPNTMPIFGSDSILQKSPYVGMPEDFYAYLFNTNTQGGDGSPMVAVSQGPYPHQQYGDFQTQYGVPYYGTEPAQMGFFPSTGPQQVMAVNNLLDQNLPETLLSEEKSTEIFEYIKERFHETDNSPIEQQKDIIMEGDRADDSHLLSRKMMQAYIGSYWLHFSDQVPILHKPTFSPDRTPVKLLIAMMTIGASCLDKQHGMKVMKAGAVLSNFLAWHLRWEIFMDPKSRPPAKLWVFQTLLLLELYEKMYSTRELHERAHIHHATTITLMRRGRSLIGKSSLDSPPNLRGDRDNSSRHSSMSGPAHTADEWWNHWITNESTRRVAFAAFVIDSIHATMFGHSTVMVAHEMRLPLPCDESLWRATSGAEVGRLEANMLSNGTKAMSFLEALKRTLSGQQVQTNSFGRTILMAGLLSVSWHMHQRDVQVLSLGGGVVQAFGGRDKWRSTLTRAFDIWKGDFDKSLHRDSASHLSGDPYAFGPGATSRTEANVVFESRIVLHHLAHMAMHVDIVECQIFARAKRLLGRAIGTQDLNSTQRKMRDVWAPSAMARDAAYYALKFLASVLVHDDAASTSPGSTTSSYTADNFEEPYSARDDVLLNRPWVLYFACLVIWCYGYALEGPCPDCPAPGGKAEQVRAMRGYLRRFAGVATPDDLKGKRGLNENSALLVVLRETFRGTRWELLNEGATLLGNCIALNAGETV